MAGQDTVGGKDGHRIKHGRTGYSWGRGWALDKTRQDKIQFGRGWTQDKTWQDRIQLGERMGTG